MTPKTLTAKTLAPKTLATKTLATKTLSSKTLAPKTTTKTTATPKTFRCPECYARVVVEPDDDAKSALWLHGLSGRCRAKQTPKTEKPRRKERLEAMLGEEWG
ncbi:MAG: hypothetical protein QOG43_1630 [Actinomycetota bacterium]|jgi:hypothetical protein|nr:hypothetical protein [Actinomycetota bacterium]